MQTIEEQYPIKDLPSVLQYLDREIARSYGCAAHQSLKDIAFSKELEQYAALLEGLRRDVELQMKFWEPQNKASHAQGGDLYDALLSLGWIPPKKVLNLPVVPCSEP